MTTPEATQLIVSLTSLLGVVFTFIQSWRNGQKASSIDTKVDLSNTKIHDIHDATNGMKDALVKSTAQASRAEGQLQERDEERARVDSKMK